ncbi:MAG TPA: ATP-binding protein, partial [Polyangiales bacterium]|nr:ATP-binding protein [Polyangiales bacterium]
MLGPEDGLIGRRRELAAVTTMLDRAASGEGGLALVTGEPGIGKTRLLEELASRAAERGFVVTWGRAWELGSAPTYWPWIEVLRALLGRPDGHDAP